MSNNKDEIRKVILTTGELMGNVGGAIVGTLIAGPLGGVIGAASGTLLSKAFSNVGQELEERFLGPREKDRLGKTIAYAAIKLQTNVGKGLLIRNDDFLQPDPYGRMPAEEILEGVLLVGQRSYEERKLRLIGNLYANICTNSNINRQQANHLIKLAESLSYRQLCMLQYFIGSTFESLKARSEAKEKSRDSSARFISQPDAIAEIRDMHQKGLLIMPSFWRDYEDNTAPLGLSVIAIGELGKLICELMDLSEIDKDDLNYLNTISKEHGED